MADGPAPRWWHAPGPWVAQVEAPPTVAPAPLDVWTMLLGGEPTMPLGPPSPRGSAPIPAGPRRSRRVVAPSVEGALAWARGELEALAAADGRGDGRGDARPSVAFRVRGDRRVRWRARSVREVRDAARAVAGWDAAPPAPAAPAASAAPPGPSVLTAAQRAVVAHDAGRAVVLAVAGAGKTTTMVARVRHRVATGRCDPAATLVVSFSRAAVAAVRAKLDADPTTAAVEARTFHALAHRLLAVRAGAAGPGRPPGALAADAVVPAVVRLARREAAANDPDLADAWRAADVAAFAAYRGRALARLELPGLAARALPASARAEARPPPPDPEHPAHPALLEDFERVRAARGWMDHDQLLVEAWAAVHVDPTLAAGARDRWRTWLIDEAQDLNAVQLALLERLTAGRDDVVLVGDDDQAIYGFRGSRPGLLRGYAAKHRARVLVLDEAFRSRAEPLAAAAALMAHAGDPGGGDGPAPRAAVRPRAVRGPGGVVTLDAADGPDGEARALLARARAHHDAGGAWRDQVALLRRFDQSPALERAAARQGVPLRLEGVAPLVRHPEVVAAWAGVALALGALHDAPSAARERAWRRWLLGPAAQTRPAALAAARALADAEGPGARAWRQRAPRGADPGVGERLATIAADADDAARALHAAGTDPRRWPVGPGPRLRAALDLLGDAGRTSAADAYAAWRRAARARAPDDAVLVTSVHRAKGLEWPVVHVPGLTDGVFPTGPDPEERRLAYVAWTRARDALHLYRDGRRPPSPFLREGAVDAVIALARDLGHLRCAPAGGERGPPRLAAVWARREAAERFGVPFGSDASPTGPGAPSDAR